MVTAICVPAGMTSGGGGGGGAGGVAAASEEGAAAGAGAGCAELDAAGADAEDELAGAAPVWSAGGGGTAGCEAVVGVSLPGC